MGKKRGATVTPAAAAPVLPFPGTGAAAADEPWHFSDYGFDDDPPFRCFSHATAKRPATTSRHHRNQTPPLESARFKLQKPISKKQHHKKQQQQRRRWWWRSATLLFFKRGSSSDATAASVNPSPYSTAASPEGPLYLAVDEDDEGAAAACACWAAPTMRSGHLAASELGASAAVLPYVSLRDAGAARGGGAPPSMPIYLVT